ncbi:Gfo/Idh/MocA family protein [Thalassoglobus polymorphus]|uniref:Glucose--fructose oxidoreductase n=1 Tax=Thalassoglobus polymorphus TaxID=2527994 RepID=A0A517QVD6_9PLAN|nr:Gfo/Idh/MocA family oxidoreductase [Thalassoglobus polymorphus]QDT35567.1 Glucose--fructose oxidoreductase precursor [Thalassoglobus polymorphus]
MSTFQVGVIGAGGIASKLHLPEMQEVENAEVVVLAGRKQSRLETLSEKFNVPRWTHSYEEVIADPEIDGVIIAVPHPLHVKYGLMALKAGKHVHIQKPLSTSLIEAEQFVEAVNASDRTVLALPYVSKPHVLAAREAVQAGTLGKVSSATARFSHGGPEVYYATIQEILQEDLDDDLWFFDAQKADVGALFDMGVYSIAHLVAILGSVKAVTCRVATLAKPTELEDTATIILEFESGVLGTAETGWCDGARTYGFSIHGTDAKVTNPSLTSDLILSRPSSLVDEDAPLIEEPIETGGYPNLNSHQEWVACAREGKQPEISNADFARHVTEIMLKSLQSSREGRTMELDSRL